MRKIETEHLDNEEVIEMMLCNFIKHRASHPHRLSRGRPDNDTVLKATIVFSVVALIAAAAVTMVATDGSEDHYRIYIGMDGNATQSQMNSVEFQIKNLISGDHKMGYTMYWANGAYVDDDEMFENRTLVIVLLDASDSDVDSIVGAALELDGVSSVAKETYDSSLASSPTEKHGSPNLALIFLFK